MIINKKFKKSEKGAAVMTSVLIVIAVSSALLSSLVFTTVKNAELVKNEENATRSYYAAESGVEDSIYRIKAGKIYSYSNSLSVGNSTANISIVENSNVSTITVNGDTNNSIKKIETTLTLSAAGADFFYGVQVGEGGLTMGNNAEVIGNIYSNGSMYGLSGATITGDAVVAGSLNQDTSAKSTVCNTDNAVGQALATSDYAQSFSPTASGILSKLSIYIKKVGNPNSVNIKIANDVSGNPDITSIAQGTLDKNLVTTSYGWVDVVLDSPVSLSSSNKYWIIIDTSPSSTKYWVWCSDSNNGYGNGVGKYAHNWTEGPWTQITGDLNFKVYFGSGAGTIDGVIVDGDAYGNTITNSKVCGDAYYQNIDASSLSFLNSPSTPCTVITNGTAYPANPDPTPAAMPISQGNIDQWKLDAQAGGTISGSYSVGNESLGPVYITGDMSIINGASLTVTGTIYVAGNITIDNNATIGCDSGYAATSCIIVTDGEVSVSNNSIFSGSGQSGSYLLLLTTSNCDGSSCVAIDVNNNSSGVIFYASNGEIKLHNGANVTQATAYKLDVDNNAVVNYEMGLASASFSSGPSAGWAISNWKEVK